MRKVRVDPRHVDLHADDLWAAAPGEVLMDFRRAHPAVFLQRVDDGMDVDEFREVDLDVMLELRIGLLRVVRESHGSAPWVSPVATRSGSENAGALRSPARRAPDRDPGQQASMIGVGYD